jgi:hypothetical protein
MTVLSHVPMSLSSPEPLSPDVMKTLPSSFGRWTWPLSLDCRSSSIRLRKTKQFFNSDLARCVYMRQNYHAHYTPQWHDTTEGSLSVVQFIRRAARDRCHAPRPGPVEWQPPRAYRPENLYTRKAKKQVQTDTVDRKAHLFILQVLFTFRSRNITKFSNASQPASAALLWKRHSENIDCIQKHKGG